MYGANCSRLNGRSTRKAACVPERPWMLMRNAIVAVAAVAMLAFTPSTMQAQFAGTGPRDNFRDTTILRPPTGS
jgi:hypothetical protein